MATFSRHVEIDWTGNLMEGSGQAVAGTGAFTLPVTFGTRIGEPCGGTSPEELIAGALGVCYTMVLSNMVAKKGGQASKLHVKAEVTADKSDAGIKVVTATLTPRAEGLTGMSAEDFTATAKEAESKCPVANALRGNVQIDVN
ncbi:MAG: OsmC family peroxiredoxin [Acidobacteriota bacterium]|nr:OsmC family peroxiredoxin [Acidobacteriota bacterium]